MELFSTDKIKDIVTVIKPKSLLIFGFKTYEKMKKIFQISDEKVIYRRKGSVTGDRLMLEVCVNGIRAIVMVHPSGARLNIKDREAIIKLYYRR